MGNCRELNETVKSKLQKITFLQYNFKHNNVWQVE